MPKISSLFRKKKRLGFAEKQRPKEEINQEYNHHAVMYGHTACVMTESQRALDHHLDAMLKLRHEGSKLPVEQPTKEEAKPESTPAEPA